MYALHSLYSPPGRLQRSGLIVKYGLTSIHTIHTFLPCASSHPSLIRASPHPPIYLGCACPFQQRAFCPPDTLWADEWIGCHIILMCDNSAVVDAINKKSMRGITITILQFILLIAAIHDIELHSKWLSSEDNAIADALSRHQFDK